MTPNFPKITMRTKIGKRTLNSFAKEYGKLELSRGRTAIFLSTPDSDGYHPGIILPIEEDDDQLCYSIGGLLDEDWFFQIRLIKDKKPHPIIHGSNLELSLKSGIWGSN